MWYETLVINRWIVRGVCVVCVVGCGKGSKQEAPSTGSAATGATGSSAKAATGSAAKAPDPECSAKVKELAPWLESFELERSSYEIDFGYKLQPIDRAPMPVEQKIDALEIKPTGMQAFDATESNHADTKLDPNPSPKAVEERLATIHGMPNDKPDRIRIDVDQKALWKDVVRAVQAAEKAGYKQAVFGFTGTSKLAVPAGLEPWTTKREDVDAAGKKLEEMHKQCEAWGHALFVHKFLDSEIDNAKAMASEVAAAIEKCSCAVNIDDMKTQLFKEARWHQAVPRVPVEIAIGEGDKSIEVVAPGKAPWSEAHAKLVEAAAEGAPPPTIRFKAK